MATFFLVKFGVYIFLSSGLSAHLIQKSASEDSTQSKLLCIWKNTSVFTIRYIGFLSIYPIYHAWMKKNILFIRKFKLFILLNLYSPAFFHLFLANKKFKCQYYVNSKVWIHFIFNSFFFMILYYKLIQKSFRVGLFRAFK